MSVEFFDDAPFVYDRDQYPLFFTPLAPHEQAQQALSMQRVAREYFRLGSDPASSHLTCLSNGMTLGEYAMHVCVARNAKRRKDELEDVETP
jgi:hypothetical protein